MNRMDAAKTPFPTVARLLTWEADVVDAAFRSILARDWPRLRALQRAFPHLTLDPGRPWTTTYPVSFQGARGSATWSGDDRAYVVEADTAQLARWMGFRVASDEGVEFVFRGCRQTPAGTWAAQFSAPESVD